MSVRERQDHTLRSLLTQVDAVLCGTGLKRSPALFSAGDLPKSLVDNSYCMAIQSADTQLYREGGEDSARVVHQLTLSVLKQIRPMAQFESLLAAGDIEEKIMALSAKKRELVSSVLGADDEPMAPKGLSRADIEALLADDDGAGDEA